METKSTWIREWIEGFMTESVCPTCNGARLSEGVLAVKINHKNIYEVTKLSIDELLKFLQNLKLNKEQSEIASTIIKEI